MKKAWIWMFVLMLAFAAAGCAKKPDVEVRVTALNGPTGMGISRLAQQAQKGETEYDYAVDFAASADDVTGALISGEVDIAAVPTNLAAVLNNKTEGEIVAVAINTLGVLYIVEQGESVHTVADLAGRTIVAAGQGAVPEYALNHILEQNGIAGQVEVEYVSEHAEAVTRLVAGEADLILAPEPFVTTALAKAEGARIALDLTEEWKTVSDSELAMGCLVTRKTFAEEYPAVLERFLEAYQASTEYVNAKPDEAAKTIVELGILADEAVAKAAIPNCNIVYLDGEEMQKTMDGTLAVLFAANPQSVGGTLPADGLYLTE